MRYICILGSRIELASLSVAFICISVGCGRGLVSAQIPRTDLVATGSGVAVTSRELDQLFAGRLIKLRAQEYELKRQALEDRLAQLLLTRAAATLNITPKELEKREVQDRVQQVTEADVQSFVEKNKARFGKARVPDRDLLKSIGEGLQAQRLEDRRQDYYRDLRSKAGIQIHLEPPRVPVGVDGGAVKGPATAPVTIVEFSDFQCPFCSRAAQVLKQIEERYKGQVRVVFRDFPLPKHEQAAKAAEAASCANEQGHFWPMHDRIFENQANLQTGDLKRLASEIGLNREAFDRCLDTGKYANRLRRDVEEGESYGVRGTPTLFINGRLITKPLTYGYVVSVIEEELAAMRQQASRHTRQDTPFQNPDHGS